MTVPGPVSRPQAGSAADSSRGWERTPFAGRGPFSAEDRSVAQARARGFCARAHRLSERASDLQKRAIGQPERARALGSMLEVNWPSESYAPVDGPLTPQGQPALAPCWPLLVDRHGRGIVDDDGCAIASPLLAPHGPNIAMERRGPPATARVHGRKALSPRRGGPWPCLSEPRAKPAGSGDCPAGPRPTGKARWGPTSPLAPSSPGSSPG